MATLNLTENWFVLFDNHQVDIDNIMSFKLSDSSIEIISLNNQPEPFICLLSCLINQKPFIIFDFKLPQSFRNRYLQLLDHATLCPSGSFYILTSGTSGNPKLCCHSILSLFLAAKRSLENMNLNDEAFLLSLSPSSMGGLMTIVKSLVSGLPLFISLSHWKRFLNDPYSLHLTLVPQQLSTLSECFPDKASVTSILIGGDVVTPIQSSYLKSFNVPFSLSYGLTETCGQVVASSFSTESSHPLFTLANVDLKRTETGSLMIATNTLAHGYLSDTGLLPILNNDGYFLTNDLVQLDPFQYVGRLDFQFQNGSKLVSPELVEKILMASELIDHIIVIPKIHDRYGSVPVAYLKNLSNLDQLKDFAVQHLPTYLQPVEYKQLPESLSFSSVNLRKDLIDFNSPA